MNKPPHHILIIKHGALGDLILATGPMKAIRRHHPQAHITLLTTKPFAGLMQDCPFIDEIWIDPRPKLWQFGRLRALIHRLRSRQFNWVYDLQTSARSTRYFYLFARPKPYYSGLHPKGSHPHDTLERTRLHTIERQKQQLAIAGIDAVPPPDISWLRASHPYIVASEHPFVLLVPGGSAHRPAKRWPAEHYAQLVAGLIDRGYQPVLIGAGAEADLLHTIEHTITSLTSEPRPLKPVNLCNQTSFAQIAELARHAACAVGNDTGPMHLIAAAGCPCSVLFNTTESNPDLCAPRGEHVDIITTHDMSRITPPMLLSQIGRAHV